MADMEDVPLAYYWMTEDAWKEGFEEGYKQGLKLAHQEAMEKVVERFRTIIVEIVKARFPKLARFARKQISDVENLDLLKRLVLVLPVARDLDEARRHLLTVDEEEVTQ
jgi:flagellar biosynthesis/type III secretory pathway protein FliH